MTRELHAHHDYVQITWIQMAHHTTYIDSKKWKHFFEGLFTFWFSGAWKQIPAIKSGTSFSAVFDPTCQLTLRRKIIR
jgi:hypothetical protein